MGVYTGRNVKLYQGSPNRYTDGIQNKATPDVSFQYFHYNKGDPKCCGVSHKATRIVGGNETEVNLGEHDTTDSEGIVMQLSNKTEHHNYNPNNGRDPSSIDVSILKLRSPISFSLTMSPICLPETKTNLYKDVTSTVSGWVQTSSNGPASKVLLDVEVKET